MLGFPLALGEDHPGDLIRQAAFEDVSEERLDVTDEADLGFANSELFPKQSHEPVAMRPAGRVAVPAGRENQPAAPGNPPRQGRHY